MIFTKNPVKGKVKTRLAVTLGEEKALAIYKQLLQYTYDITQHVHSDKTVLYSENIPAKDLWSEGNFQKAVQEGEGLGERMLDAFEKAFSKGYQKVIIIGSDSLDITTELIEEAIDKLNNHDVVIGPSEDGGYYLLGMKKLYPPLFKNKKWSTESVFIDTIEDIMNLGITHYNLPTYSDIDTENDWNKALKK